MTHRISLLIAGALTVFVLVLMIGVGTTVAVKSFVTTQAAPSLQAPAANMPAQQPAPGSNDGIGVRLSPDQAARIAARVAPSAKLIAVPELVDFQGTVAYEVVLNQGNVYVDAQSGQVLFNGANAATRLERYHEDHEEDDDD